MAFETKENELFLFTPKERKSDTHAHLEGKVIVGGKLHWANAWRNTDKNGNEYLKVVLKPAQERAEQISNEAGFGRASPRPEQSYGQQSGGNFSRDEDDSDLPF